uniref:Uncharacterized protein n=1 Tax=Ditylenchus dipsaci TaxID=166011 RepID=A0A915CRP1_9BILA
MKFVVLAVSFASIILVSLAEESPVGAGDGLKDAVVDATTLSTPNVTIVMHSEPVNSEQKVNNLSASKDKPEESVADKVSGAANDAKDAVNGAAKTAGQAVSDAAGSAAEKPPMAVQLPPYRSCQQFSWLLSLSTPATRLTHNQTSHFKLLSESLMLGDEEKKKTAKSSIEYIYIVA